MAAPPSTPLTARSSTTAADIRAQRRSTDLAKARWDEALDLKNKDDSALREARERRDKLLQLVGSCQYGAISYSECSYVQQQRSTVSLSAQKEVGVLKRSVEDLEEREAGEKANYEREAAALEVLTKAQQQKTDRKTVLNSAVGGRQRQLGEGDSVRKTLTEWQEKPKGTGDRKLRTTRSKVSDLEKKLRKRKGREDLSATADLRP
ncbi:MAG: hypothetical protein IPQ09_13810 [Myxococcales bacterium]|nr:hypothetical protein [Myxococcales bacterium]